MPLSGVNSERKRPSGRSFGLKQNELPNVPEKSEIEFAVSEPKYSIKDLILSKTTEEEIITIINARKNWYKVFDEWGLEKVLKYQKNLLVNLYGASGTGKTMTAHAIAKGIGKKLVCVNYADIESKYVGDTGKNLIAMFKYAEEKDCIIFFDEADALLSKRVTDMSRSTDISVNQTRSVLLTQLNDYTGMVIFATNFISNYDSAFMRRIQYHVKFDLPNERMRRELWRIYTPEQMPTNLNISKIAHDYEGVSGSDISTAVLRAALKAADLGERTVPHKYFEEAVEKILEGKQENNGEEYKSRRVVSEEYVFSQIGSGYSNER